MPNGRPCLTFLPKASSSESLSEGTEDYLWIERYNIAPLCMIVITMLAFQTCMIPNITCTYAEVWQKYTVSVPIQYNHFELGQGPKTPNAWLACTLWPTTIWLLRASSKLQHRVLIRTTHIHGVISNRRLDQDKWPVYCGDIFHEFVISCNVL